MFRGTPCSFLQDIFVRRTYETLLTISKLYGLGFVIIKIFKEIPKILFEISIFFFKITNHFNQNSAQYVRI